MARETPRPQPEEAEEPQKLSRRELLKTGLKFGAGAAVVGALGTKEFIEHQIEERSEAVADMSKFLRGQDKGTIEMFGRKFNYEQFVGFVRELMVPQPESPQTVKALLDSFTYMMEVEDRFGGKLNTLPLLESVDRVTEPYLSTASSFGYGQINAQTARGLALRKAEQLLKANVINEQQLARLQNEKIPEHEIVDTLDLSGNGNIPISFLYFKEGYDQYGRSTGGRVHGVSESARMRGRLSADRKVDPRAFGLAVSAYSAKLESPMAAKAQTYMNEMLLADSSLREKMSPVLAEAGLTDKLLEVDGDLGPNTLKVLTELSNQLGLSTPAFADKEWKGDRLAELDKWLAAARGEWQKRIRDLWDDKNQDPHTLKELVSRRYHGVVTAYNILRRMFPDKSARIRELFLQYADTRQSGFVDLIEDPAKFETEFDGSQNHSEFVAKLASSLPDVVNYDERYRGYIPMGYAAAPRLLADPKNIMMRVLLAHESDDSSRSKISLKQ